MTITTGSVVLEKDGSNLIGISIGGGAPYCPCLYIVQVRFSLGSHQQCKVIVQSRFVFHCQRYSTIRRRLATEHFKVGMKSSEWTMFPWKGKRNPKWPKWSKQPRGTVRLIHFILMFRRIMLLYDCSTCWKRPPSQKPLDELMKFVSKWSDNVVFTK